MPGQRQDGRDEGHPDDERVEQDTGGECEGDLFQHRAVGGEEGLPHPRRTGGARLDPRAPHPAALSQHRRRGSRLVRLGAVGHLNPASGYGEWHQGEELIRMLESVAVELHRSGGLLVGGVGALRAGRRHRLRRGAGLRRPEG
ncbi:alpha/beta hydrolase [Streptomyces sp. NPDC096311]|uniref:alpha/beta hydrolase n=1 Tax=Streptomyces sp. NPDC096311 TaxID=3366083 RepID=UPI00380B2920